MTAFCLPIGQASVNTPEIENIGRQFRERYFEGAIDMKLGMINSAWAQAGRDTAWGIEKTKQIGFDCIDIFADPFDIDIKERILIKKECDRHELPIVSVCCVAVGLLDLNPSVRRFHTERVIAYLDMCYEFGAENLLLVLGEYIWNREVIPPEEQWGYGVETCRELAEYAADLGLDIALELEPFDLSLLNSIDAMTRFIDEVNHPALRANIDISHLLLANIDASEIAKLKGRACHVHISDCDGKKHGDLPPGRGVVDFPPYLEQIRKLSIPGTISLELEYSPDPAKIEDWVREAYDATAKLMSESGLRD